MMLWTPHKAIFRTQKMSPHKNRAMEIWDIWAKMGPFWAPGGPEGTQYQVKVGGDHESNPGRPMGGSWDKVWSTGALQGLCNLCNTMQYHNKYGAMEIWAKMGPFWAPGGDPEGTQYQVRVSGDHEYNPGRPMGGSWDQIWSPGAHT